MILVPLATFCIENPEMARPLQKLIWQLTEDRMIQTAGEVTEKDIADIVQDPSSFWKVGVLPDQPYKPVVGVAGLQKYNAIDGTAESCVAIFETERRKGYGTKLATLIREWGVSTLNLRRITNYLLADSPGLHVDRKLGYTHEGTLKNYRYRNGRYIDVLIYSWLREEN